MWNIVAALVGAITILLSFWGRAERITDRLIGSPPQDVVEGFVRELVTGDFDRAMPYLRNDLATQTHPVSLEIWAANLESVIGPIHDIRGEVEWTSRHRAQARAVLATASREVTISFHLVLEDGHWSIADVTPLSQYGHEGLPLLRTAGWSGRNVPIANDALFTLETQRRDRRSVEREQAA
jgi:hypothetical protein